MPTSLSERINGFGILTEDLTGMQVQVQESVAGAGGITEKEIAELFFLQQDKSEWNMVLVKFRFCYLLISDPNCISEMVGEEMISDRISLLE